MDALINFLHSIYPMPVELEEHLRTILKMKLLKKKEALLTAGNTCKNVYFVSRGLLRSYYLNDDNEVSKWFMKEGDVVFAVKSFLTQTPSDEFIEVLEDCKLYYITYHELQNIYKNYMSFNFQRGILTEKYYVLSEERSDTVRLLKPVDRYKFLLKEYPELVGRVQTNYLASYIGVSRSTLYRLKEKVKLKRKSGL